MVNFRIIARIISLVIIAEGLFLLLTAGVSVLTDDGAASSFLYSAIITLVLGIITFTPLRHNERISGNREGYILVSSTWILFSLFGTLPFLFSGATDNFIDAFFETLSGFTTTGATILTDIESLPESVLFWRSLTQWIGGLGIILISLSVFPIVKSINIQIASSDFSGQQADRIQPRFIESAKRLVSIYFLLTMAQTLLLFFAGMPFFDSVCHSLSTLSTGGFSTKHAGISAFASPVIKVVMTLFMFIAGISLPLIYFGLKGNFKKIRGNQEFRFYVILTGAFILLSTLILIADNGFRPLKALSESFFQVVSFISTTGYYNSNYMSWGNIMIMVLFILMFTGGTAGSTSGGIKVIRLMLITINYRMEMHRLIHPNAFIPVRIDDHVVTQSNIYNLLVFVTLYFITICAGSLGISIMGYDLVTSFSTSASMLANIGPGLGEFGPFSNYASLPAGGKLFLSGLMLIGRLELFTFMALFSNSFYRH